MPTAHKVLVKAGESALSRTSAAATATSSSTADAWEVFQFQVSEEHRLNEVHKTVNELSIEKFLYHWLVVLNGCNENSRLKAIFDKKMTKTKDLESYRQEAMTRYKQLTFIQRAVYTAISKEYFKKHDKLKKTQNEHDAKHIAAPTSYDIQQPIWYYDIYQPIWYYRDNTSYAIQGPFSGHQMLGWRYFFPPTTPVRFGDGSHFHFVPLSCVDFTNPPVPPQLINVNNVGEDNATKKETNRASMVNDNKEPRDSDGWDVIRFQIREEKRTNKVFNSAEEFLYHWLVEINGCDESSSPKPIFMNNQKKSHKKTQDNFHQEAAARYKQLTYTQRALYRAIAKEYFRKKRSDNAGSNATVKSEEIGTDNKEVLVKAGESALGRTTSAAATATSSSTADAWEVFQFQVSEEHRLNEVHHVTVDKLSIEKFLYHWLVVLNGRKENSRLKPIFDKKMTKTKPPKDLEREATTRYKQLTFTQRAMYTAISKEYFKRYDHRNTTIGNNTTNSNKKKSYYDGWEVFKVQLGEEHHLNKVFNTAEEFLYHWLVVVNGCDENSIPTPIFKHKRQHEKTTKSTGSKFLESFKQIAKARYQSLTFTQRALYRAIGKEYFRKKTKEDSPVKLKGEDDGEKKKRRMEAPPSCNIDSVNVGNEMKKKPKKATVQHGCGSGRKGGMKMSGKIGQKKLKQKDEGRKKSNVGWDEMFKQLKKYKEQNGHCRVPQKYKANPQLGRWVNTQRQQYKKKNQDRETITEEQINRLEGIGFVWELRRGPRSP